MSEIPNKWADYVCGDCGTTDVQHGWSTCMETAKAQHAALLASFAWKDVWELRSLASCVRTEADAGLSLPVLDIADAETLEGLATRLQALLPPPPEETPK